MGELTPHPLSHRGIFNATLAGGHDCQPGGGDTHVGREFDVVVSLYAREGYGPAAGVPHFTHTMVDGPMAPEDHEAVHRLADRVGEALDAGLSVLVRCQAGVKRARRVFGCW